MKYEKMNNLFLRQSYLDSWEDYERSLKKKSFIKWDYIILTASNEAQATAYRNQIENRLEKGLLPEETTYAVLPDSGGKTCGIRRSYISGDALYCRTGTRRERILLRIVEFL